MDNVRTAGNTAEPPPEVTGLILAGGQGSRMGGVDKGLLRYQGRPLITWTLDCLAPQVSRMMISANRNQDEYATFGHPVVSDAAPTGFDGPLAGLQAGLRACITPFVAVVPCDSPHLPTDLVEKLVHAFEDSETLLAYAATSVRTHPVFMLCHTAVLPSLDAYLAHGNRKIRDWQAGISAMEVIFPDEACFANINTPEDLGKS